MSPARRDRRLGAAGDSVQPQSRMYTKAWTVSANTGFPRGCGAHWTAIVPPRIDRLHRWRPRVFAHAPLRSLAHVLGRLSITLLVGGVLVETATGVRVAQHDDGYGCREALRANRLSVRNCLSAPAAGSGLEAPVCYPGIVRQGATLYGQDTGLTQQPFLGRWLLLTAVLFAVSALGYAIQLAVVQRRSTITESRNS